MALYTTFGEILTMARVEARLSPSAAVGSDANTRYKQIVNRVYETLYDDFDWPHLRYEAPRIALAAGQRYYDFPAGVNYGAIDEMVAWWADEPYPLDPGIGFEQYSAFSSEDGERSDPPLRYDIRSESAGTTQIEIWPLPASDDVELQVRGKRAWSKLVNSSDICLLDDTMVALYAAASILRPINAADADDKLVAAERRRMQVRGRSVQPQTGGSSAPSVGTDSVHVGMRGNKAVVRVGRS